MDEREAEARDWLAGCGQAPEAVALAAGDASARRYFRVWLAAGSRILMDAPPEREAIHGYLAIQQRLRAAGMAVPAVYAADVARGFVLLEDLGGATALEAMRAGVLAGPEYLQQALALLVAMQTRVSRAELPPYDEALLGRELDLFKDWYLGRELGMVLTGEQRRVWHAARERLIAAALAQPRVFVHRDFMARNLMPRAAGLAAIDFQDAVAGPITYDPVCLLRDAFIEWSPETERDWLGRYHRRGLAAGLPLPAELDALYRAVDCMGAQRHLKVIGIFARLAHRDGKSGYLEDCPRFFRYLQRELTAQPELAELRAWLAELEPACAL